VYRSRNLVAATLPHILGVSVTGVISVVLRDTPMLSVSYNNDIIESAISAVLF